MERTDGRVAFVEPEMCVHCGRISICACLLAHVECTCVCARAYVCSCVNAEVSEWVCGCVGEWVGESAGWKNGRVTPVVME